MKELKSFVNESANENKNILMTVMSPFKDGEDTVMSMISKRIAHWDANKGRHSREPMFLCSWNRQSISWATVSSLNIKLGDGEENIDSGTNFEMFDGFLSEYLKGITTEHDQYILGVFIDRCFIPIFNKEIFTSIWDKISQ